jgi:mRNA interferase RelE/StbE
MKKFLKNIVMSKVKWSKNSLDFLDKLDKKEAERIVRKIDEIKENPIRFIQGLINKDFGKIKFGKFRLFVDFFIKENTLIIHSIKCRKNAYKKQ